MAALSDARGRIVKENRVAWRALNSLSDGVVIARAEAAGPTGAEDGEFGALAVHTAIDYINPAFEKITGYGAADVLNRDARFLYGADRDQEGLQVLRQAIRENKSCVTRLRNYRKDGGLFWNDLTLSPMHDGQDNLTHFIGVVRDVTERELLRRELEELNARYQKLNRKLELEAETDQLTRVFNRRFLDTAGKLIFETAKRESLNLSLYLVDLDHFKRINDQQGHKAGDHYLQLVSVMLRQFFNRASDAIVRYGGDEFIVMSTGETRDNAALRGEGLCQWISDQAAQVAGGQFSGSTVSVGVYSAIPAGQDSLEKFVKQADEALYQSKNEGRNRSTLK